MNIGTANYVITRQIQNSNIPFKYQVNLPWNTPVGLPNAFQRKTNRKHWIKYIKPIWCPQHIERFNTVDEGSIPINIFCIKTIPLLYSHHLHKSLTISFSIESNFWSFIHVAIINAFQWHKAWKMVSNVTVQHSCKDITAHSAVRFWQLDKYMIYASCGILGDSGGQSYMRQKSTG